MNRELENLDTGTLPVVLEFDRLAHRNDAQYQHLQGSIWHLLRAVRGINESLEPENETVKSACRSIEDGLVTIGVLVTDHRENNNIGMHKVRVVFSTLVEKLSAYLGGMTAKIEATSPVPSVHDASDPAVRAKVLALTDGHCAYCHTKLPVLDGAVKFAVEHVVPSSSGGPDNLANYVPSCAECNQDKMTTHVVEFIRNTQAATNIVKVDFDPRKTA